MHSLPESNPIYLDYNATTPVRQEAIDKMTPFMHHFGNPSSSHALGDLPKQALREARLEVAKAVGAPHEDSIYFCSCGTEADNWAIWSAICEYRVKNPDKMPHVVSSVIEHPAVLLHLQQLHRLKLLEYDLVPVDSEGFLDLHRLESSIRPETCLVTIMHSNNEIGTIQKFAEICDIVQRCDQDIVLHSDMAQSIGRAPINLQDMRIDMCTIVAHKFGGPKGVAALYCRPGVELHPFLCGGGQESGKRSGTENVLLATGMGESIRCACKDIDSSIHDMKSKRDLLFDLLNRHLLERLQQEGLFRLHGPTDDAYRLPNTLSFGIKGIDSRVIIQSLRDNVAMSSGSACHSSSATSGGVLNAIGCPQEYQFGTFRLSVGHYLTREEIETAALLLSRAIEAELNRNQN